jgi:hypothetical protein
MNKYAKCNECADVDCSDGELGFFAGALPRGDVDVDLDYTGPIP